MDFNEFSKETVKHVDQELKRLLKQWRSEVGKIDKSLLSVVDKFIKANEGGKRIRGILVVLGYEIAREKGEGKKGKLEEEEIIKIAAAYEIFHTAILAHDDIIDKSLTRRNQPSLYQALGGDHQGISLAISLADAGFFLAGKIISESTAKLHLGGASLDYARDKKAHLRGDLTVKALRWFSQTMLDTSLGQILDIQGGDNLTVVKYKTAKYTVSGPLVLGAILAGAKSHLGGAKVHLRGNQLLKNLAEFGENLGIAFQIQDDILDGEIGSAEKYKQSLQQLHCCKNQALKILPQITKDQQMSKLLKQIAEYLVQRNK